MQRSNVLPSVVPLTEDDAREILAPVLIALCSAHGPTRVGSVAQCDPKTIRNARDEKSLLSLDSAANLLALDGTAFDGFLNRVGRRSVPVGAVCDTDALPAMTGAVHRMVLARDPASPAGRDWSHSELFDAEAELKLAFDAIGSLLGRIDALRAAA